MPFGTRAPSFSKRAGSRRNSTTSCSSLFASSSPATSCQRTDEDDFGWIAFGLTFGIIPIVFQSSQMITTKNAIGAQRKMSFWIRAQSNARKAAAATIRGPIGNRGPELKRCDHRVRRDELDAARAPGRRAGGRARLVEPARRVLDEAHAAPAAQQAADRGVVADVGRDPEDDDLVGVERVEQRLGVRVREDVEVLLQEQELAVALDQSGDEAGRDRQRAERQRVVLLRLRDL